MRFVDFTQNTHAQPGAREGMPMHHVPRQAQFHPQFAHFILEQFAQRLEEFELHVLGQTAHIVVRLDDVCFARLAAGRLDDVGIDRALRQPFDVLELVASSSNTSTNIRR